jgi:TetR/AcrR family transcriptional regulator, fatty acid metabolism regulator protein
MEQEFSERQIQIFNASIKLIGKGGIQLLTTKNLAVEIGLSEAAIYKHFTSKVDILKGLLTFLKTPIIKKLEKIAKSKKTPTEKLKQLFIEHSKAFTERPEIAVVLLSEGLYQYEKELSDIVFALMQESKVFYQMIIEEGQQTGVFKKNIDSKQLTFIIMGSLRFNVIQWHLSGFKMNLSENHSKLFDTIGDLILNK